MMEHDHEDLPDPSTEWTQCGIAVSLPQTPSFTLVHHSGSLRLLIFMDIFAIHLPANREAWSAWS